MSMLGLASPWDDADDEESEDDLPVIMVTEDTGEQSFIRLKDSGWVARAYGSSTPVLSAMEAPPMKPDPLASPPALPDSHPLSDDEFALNTPASSPWGVGGPDVLGSASSLCLLVPNHQPLVYERAPKKVRKPLYELQRAVVAPTTDTPASSTGHLTPVEQRLDAHAHDHNHVARRAQADHVPEECTPQAVHLQQGAPPARQPSPREATSAAPPQHPHAAGSPHTTPRRRPGASPRRSGSTSPQQRGTQKRSSVSPEKHVYVRIDGVTASSSAVVASASPSRSVFSSPATSSRNGYAARRSVAASQHSVSSSPFRREWSIASASPSTVLSALSRISRPTTATALHNIRRQKHYANSPQSSPRSAHNHAVSPASAVKPGARVCQHSQPAPSGHDTPATRLW